MGLCSLGQVNGSLFARFATRAGLPGDASLCQVVNAVHAIPYGRPRSRTAEGVIHEWKGTCSTKHALLAALEASYCDPQVREPFIAALALASGLAGSA